MSTAQGAAERHVDLQSRLSSAAPESMRAALGIVLELHAPQPACAGVLPERFGEGRCCMCWQGEPDRVFLDYLNDSRRKVDQHQHGVYDWCSTCSEGGRYPCRTVQCIAEEFSVASAAAQEVGR